MGAMAEGEGVRYPECRAGAGVRGLGLSGVGVVGVAAGVAQLAWVGVSVWVVLGVSVLFVVLYVLMRLAFRRSATVTGDEGIVVRGVFGGRVVAWRDVQAIEVEAGSAAVGDGGVVPEFVCLYDRHGRRVLLPHLNSRHLFALHEDVRELRALWELRRGAEWEELPAVAAWIARARRSRDRHSDWMRGVLAGMGANIP
ncbi:PH domain-containing protein [Streptomyces lasiicapitis]|uniref:PH domain-containing protein n=1 Tax=Streptomyces lasiicapitis TaxID=1923961 RepID=UPI00365689E5